MYYLELIGIAAFAVSGAMIGVERRADVFGVFILAVVTALGGGVLRDTMLGRLPPRMFTSYVYIALAGACAALVFLDARARRESFAAHKKQLDAVVNLFDAVGLAAFTVSGMDLSISDAGIGNPVLIIVLGVLTGVGGGVLRDLLTGAMPAVLYKRVYAVASALGALGYYVLLRLGVPAMAGAVAAMLLIFALRMLATVYRWNLPRA